MKGNIQIHLVSDDYCENCEKEGNSFYEYMCDAHTHGMNEYGHRELQFVLNIAPSIIGYLINTIAKKILNGEIKPKDKMMCYGIIKDYAIRLDEARDEDGELLWRIIIPDAEGKFPEETSDKVYAKQLQSPYIDIF